MRYSRVHVSQALSAAREAGKDLDGLKVGDRETIIALERWGFLPIDQQATDAKVAEWYRANGLATLATDTPGDTPDRVPTSAALAAAEAAIEAARMALALARSVTGDAA